MALHGLNPEDRFVATSRDILDRYGVRLEIGRDWDIYNEYVASARPDHRVGDPFDEKIHDLSGNKSCWIVGRDTDGDLMHLQALRVLPTNGDTVGDYFRHNFHDFSPSALDIDFKRSRYRAGPGAKRMKGRVVYSGETWVGGKPGQYRGTGISTVLGRFALLTALRELSADYVVGFMAKPVAYKGFCLRMGFMHAEPMALRWFVKGTTTPLEGVMVYMSDEDIRFSMDLPTADLEALAA